MAWRVAEKARKVLLLPVKVGAETVKLGYGGVKLGVNVGVSGVKKVGSLTKSGASFALRPVKVLVVGGTITIYTLGRAIGHSEFYDNYVGRYARWVFNAERPEDDDIGNVMVGTLFEAVASNAINVGFLPFSLLTADSLQLGEVVLARLEEHLVAAGHEELAERCTSVGDFLHAYYLAFHEINRDLGAPPLSIAQFKEHIVHLGEVFENVLRHHPWTEQHVMDLWDQALGAAGHLGGTIFDLHDHAVHIKLRLSDGMKWVADVPHIHLFDHFFEAITRLRSHGNSEEE